MYVAPDGLNIWVGERCGGNQGACMQQQDWDPVMLFAPNGELLRSFGAGMIVWPHGLHVDSEGNVWVADAAGAGDKGHQVHMLLRWTRRADFSWQIEEIAGLRFLTRMEITL